MSGVVKGQKKVTLHQLRSVPVTNSGIDIEAWRNRLITVHEEADHSEGPTICDDNGFLMTNNEMNNLFWTVLEELYLESPDDFPKDISSIDLIRVRINIYRTLRHSASTQTKHEGITEDDQNIVCRWRKKQYSKGKAPVEQLHIGYLEQEFLNEVFAHFTIKM